MTSHELHHACGSKSRSPLATGRQVGSEDCPSYFQHYDNVIIAKLDLRVSTVSYDSGLRQLNAWKYGNTTAYPLPVMLMTAVDVFLSLT